MKIERIKAYLAEISAQWKTGAGSGRIEKVEKVGGGGERVCINADQYFDNVPQSAWDAYIGGYQPAQKWLKDRKGRVLTNDELAHYKSIIFALLETAKLTAQLSAGGLRTCDKGTLAQGAALRDCRITTRKSIR